MGETSRGSFFYASKHKSNVSAEGRLLLRAEDAEGGVYGRHIGCASCPIHPEKIGNE